MKNVFLGINLFICATLLFSSCNHNTLSITKRQYRSGYYISRASEGASQKVKLQDSTYEQNNIASKKNVEPSLAVVLPERGYNSGKAKEEVYSASIDKIPLQHKKEFSPSNSLLINSKMSPSKIIFKNRSSIKKIAQTSADARSILWTIAVVILIIWLIALLTGGWGLGGLINLLLLVALIVFILWLLRVI